MQRPLPRWPQRSLVILQSFAYHRVAFPAALYSRLWVPEISHAHGRPCWHGHTPPAGRDTMADQHRTTTSGAAPGLTAPAIEQLKGQVRGALLCPGDADYDSARSIHNGMIDRHPALIVRCAGGCPRCSHLRPDPQPCRGGPWRRPWCAGLCGLRRRCDDRPVAHEQCACGPGRPHRPRGGRRHVGGLRP